MRRVHARQRGLTLIELMISITIGVTVSTAGLSLYLGATKTRTAVHERIRMQENAYFVRQTLSRYLSEAGYRPLERADIGGPLLPIRTHESAFPAVGAWRAGQYLRGTVDDEGVANGIEIRALGASRADGAADGSITDCLGRSIAESTTVTMAFRTDGQHLTCTVEGTDVPVAGDADVHVERIVWKLGVDDDHDGQVERFVPATGGTGPAALRSLVAHVLLASASEVLDAPRDYVFGGESVTSSDRRLRTESIVAVEMRN